MRICVVPVKADKRVVRYLVVNLEKIFGIWTTVARERKIDFGNDPHTLLKKLPVLEPITIAVTDEPLYEESPNGPIPRFGMGEFAANKAVVSTYYLRDPNPEVTMRRALNVAMHEIGHVVGLKHCRNFCVMNPARTPEDVDHRPFAFCIPCAEKFAFLMTFF